VRQESIFAVLIFDSFYQEKEQTHLIFPIYFADDYLLYI